MKLCAIGTGAISKSMIPEFHRSDVLNCVAVCSRGEETGKAIADQFGLKKVYTSMDVMLADPDIDMVYVGSHLQEKSRPDPEGEGCLYPR